MKGKMHKAKTTTKPKAKVTGKGNEGTKGSGSKARKAINTAVKKGATIGSIAKAVGRSKSTVNQIKGGSIKNPPNELAGKVSKAKAKKKK